MATTRFQTGMKPVHTLLSIILLFTSLGLGAEETAHRLVVEVPPVVTVEVGGVAQLRCSYPCGTPNVTITVVDWERANDSHRGDKILMMDGVARFLNPRAAWAGSADTCDASISLRDVRKSDAGVYRCNVLLLDMYFEGENSLRLVVLSGAQEMTTPSPTTQPNSPSKTIGIIVGIVGSIVVLLVVGIIIVVYRWRVKRVKGDEENRREEQMECLKASDDEVLGPTLDSCGHTIKESELAPGITKPLHATVGASRTRSPVWQSFKWKELLHLDEKAHIVPT